MSNPDNSEFHFPIHEKKTAEQNTPPVENLSSSAEIAESPEEFGNNGIIKAGQNTSLTWKRFYKQIMLLASVTAAITVFQAGVSSNTGNTVSPGTGAATTLFSSQSTSTVPSISTPSTGDPTNLPSWTFAFDDTYPEEISVTDHITQNNSVYRHVTFEASEGIDKTVLNQAFDEGNVSIERITRLFRDAGYLVSDPVQTDYQMTLLSTEYSDDYLAIGDPDDPGDMMIVQGSCTRYYRIDTSIVISISLP